MYLGYDTKFIFAEVNGDRVVWLVQANGDMTPVKELCQPHSIGKSISTKAVGSSDRQDITHEYKFPEGFTVHNALHCNFINTPPLVMLVNRKH